MTVPAGAPTASRVTTWPPSRTRRVPVVASRPRLTTVTWLTAAMAASASPRKPRVRMACRSSAVFSFDVAWRRKAVSISAASMPLPLSATWMSCRPPPRMSMVMAVAPASMLFSTSSLTTDDGRSTTSPAAICDAS